MPLDAGLIVPEMDSSEVAKLDGWLRRGKWPR